MSFESHYMIHVKVYCGSEEGLEIEETTLARPRRGVHGRRNRSYSHAVH